MKKSKTTNDRLKQIDDRHRKIDVEYSSDLDTLIARKNKRQEKRQSR